jgi:hypothetical protein
MFFKKTIIKKFFILILDKFFPNLNFFLEKSRNKNYFYYHLEF